MHVRATRTRLLLAAAALGALAVLAAAALLDADETPAVVVGGPLAPPEEHARVGAAGVVDVGERYSVGFMRLHNRGEEVAELERIELLGRDPQLRLVGALVLPRVWSMGTDHGFPPPFIPPRRRATFVEAVGATIAPDWAVDVWVGIATAARGRHGFRDVAVHYRSGGRRYRTVYPISAFLCAPRSWPGNCPGD
jgi:hypothetical protein